MVAALNTSVLMCSSRAIFNGVANERELNVGLSEVLGCVLVAIISINRFGL